jgi:putative copper export protein
VRSVHVLAATVIVGGGALMWALALGRPGMGPAALARACERYEWMFWGSLALVVATGIGNLGAFGDGLPGPQTAWGQTLQIKVGLVVVLMLASAVRTFMVARLTDGGGDTTGMALRNLYALTALLGVAILGAAELLAHG